MVARRAGMLLIAAVVSLFSPGCVERRFTVRTNPPGALVYANGEELGPSPVSKSFTYYADREFTLVADGYGTTKVMQPIPAPWWDNYLTEFFTENLLPFQLRDEREFTYNLTPQVNPPAQDVLNRGSALRNQAQAPPRPLPDGPPAWFGAIE